MELRRHPRPGDAPESHPLRSRGITLTELLVVMAIIAILVSMSMLGYQAVFEGGDRAEAQAMIQRLYISIEQYRATYNVYPDDEEGEANDYFITNREPTPSHPLGGILWRLNHRRVFDDGAWAFEADQTFVFDRKWLDPVTGRLLDPWGQPYEYELGDARTDIDVPGSVDHGPPNFDGFKLDGTTPADHDYEPVVDHLVKIFSWGSHNQDLDPDEKVFDSKFLIYRTMQKD